MYLTAREKELNRFEVLQNCSADYYVTKDGVRVSNFYRTQESAINKMQAIQKYHMETLTARRLTVSNDPNLSKG